MFNRKFLFFLLFVFIISIASVSAHNVTDNDLDTYESQNELSVNGNVDFLGSDVAASAVENNDDARLSQTAKNFTELNALINNNTKYIIYLDSDYRYDSEDSFKYGITIDRSVSIYGNGHTIDGAGAARLFYITNTEVSLYDIVFANAYANKDGGAINGKCNAINCTFINNLGSWGGAMYQGYAKDCTFIGNKASVGAAFAYGYAQNCTFIDNHAEDKGGAMYGPSCRAINSTFINNTATNGGAVYGGTATASTFINNSASESGGALHGCSASNSTFICNHADQSGGAMFAEGRIADKCIFIGNSAECGGATFQINVTSCRFSDNYAGNNGGACYEGVLLNSNFTGNTAGGNGGAACNALIAYSLFEYNTAVNGGAVSGIELVSSTFNHNRAVQYGGAVYNAKVSTDSQFTNNTAVLGNDFYGVTFFDRQKRKSFCELNELINNDAQALINLNNTYAYDFITDSAFKDGILINRPLTIYGNGFTLDGDNFARIFNVRSYNVVFHDIVFANASTSGSGGAINGNSTSINCTFMANQAQFGGAIAYGSAFNSTFIGNKVIFSGGAMNGGYAENCSFIENEANDGGAMNEASAKNCDFIDNKANYGGAIHGLDYYVVNCTFIRNHAFDWGGAMYGSDCVAINSTFINNTAVDGGATYDIVAYLCRFEDNSANEYGGAMYGGATMDSIFKGNYAAECGNDTYDTCILKPHLSVSNFISTYASEDKLQINFTTAFDVPIINVTITIRVYDNDTLIDTFYCLSGNEWAVDLDVGNYLAVFSVENQEYEVDPVNATLKISKASTLINSTDVSADYGDDEYLTVTLTGSQERPISGAEIHISLWEGETFKTDENGQVNVSTKFLIPDYYIADIIFHGNRNYNGSNVASTVMINKRNTTIDLNVMTDENYLVMAVDVDSNATGLVRFDINPLKHVYCDVIDGKAVLEYFFSEGDYVVNATYLGDEKFNANSTSEAFSVIGHVKDNVSITAEVSINVNDACITVVFDANVTGFTKFYITGPKNFTLYNITENAKSSINIVDLEYGEYVVEITYLGDYDYNAANVTVQMRITPSVLIYAPDVVKYFNGSERFVVTVTDYCGTSVVNKMVIMDINGVEYTRTTDINGTASIALGLPSSTYNVTVRVDDEIAESIVTILPTVNGTDIVKVFGNATPYYATFIDTEGNYLKNGTAVQFNINGVLYERKVSCDKGLARLNINLAQGEYVITAINPETGENAANNITVLSRLVENNDIIKYYRNETQYTVKVIGGDGKPVGANVMVRFNINGVFYERTTNESGIARLNINLQPGNYIITAESEGCMVSNNITVLPVLNATDLIKKYDAGDSFVATLVNGTGSPYANRIITFNINGVFYDRITDINGRAKLNINLMAGEYIITSTYNESNIANRVTITD